jgi:hypothetical protein
MAAINVVRFQVKPGQEKAFVVAHRNMRPQFSGFQDGWLVRTGDRSFCFVGVWNSMNSIVKARPGMIALLDSVRHMLEDLGGGLGVTDPVSGEVAALLKLRKAKAKARVKRAKANLARKK